MAARKLSSEAKRLVTERIITGDTNNDIRSALCAAGHPCDLVDQSFTSYRQSKDVRQAVERRDTEAAQVGYARRSERILCLSKSAQRLMRRLEASPDAPDFLPGTNLSDLLALHREFRETLRDIGDLVDPRRPVAVTGAGGGPVQIIEVRYADDWRASEGSKQQEEGQQKHGSSRAKG